MKRLQAAVRLAVALLTAALLTAALLTGIAAHAQTIVTGNLEIGTGKELTTSLPGATAAYVVDPEIADVMVEAGTVLVLGKYRGTTHLVVISDTAVTTYQLTVFESPHESPRNAWVTSPAYGSSGGGTLDSEFDSQGRRFSNSLVLIGKSRDVQTRLVFSTVLYAYSPGDPLSLANPSRFVLSGISYDIRSKGRRITLFDQLVKESPLTVYNASIRGFHIEERGWFLHLGYTSPALFDGVFLPTRPEGVFGGGHRYSLRPHASVTFSLYRFTAAPPATGSASVSSQPGTVLSAQYAWHPGENMRFTTEIGVSRSIGQSSELFYSRSGETLTAHFRYSPEDFPSLTANRFPGLKSDATWNKKWSTHWYSDAYWNSTHYIAPGITTSNTSGGGILGFEADGHWSLNTGLSASSSSSLNAAPLKGIQLPFGAQFHSRHLSAGFDYQRTQQTGVDEGGRSLRASLSVAAGPFQISAYALQQTQTPTLQYVLTQTPGLQESLLAQGLSADTPQQIADFLQNNAALISQGLFRSLGIYLVPRRQQAEGSLTWHSPGRKAELSYDFLYNGDESISSATESVIHRLSWRLKLSDTTQLQAGWFGSTTKPTTGPPFLSAWSVGMRRQLGPPPAFMVRERRGTISGKVFADQESSGKLSPDSSGVAGVEVILDRERRARTGSDGRFVFTAVVQGQHDLRANLKSDAGYFTTSGVVQTNENGTVNFGVARLQGTLVGILRNDAGKGVGQATVALRRLDGPVTMATTGGDGDFMVSHLEYGQYEATVDPATLPPGYALEGDLSSTVSVTPAAAGRLAFQVKAIRNVAGQVEITDSTGKRTPGAGLEIVVPELSRKAKTDARGRYLFRELPAGKFTLSLDFEGRPFIQKITLPDEPAQRENVNFSVTR
jgi:hypothetical protein